jgi:hypothetical protein
MILPSETRTIAEIARTLRASKERPEKIELLYDALVTLGRGDGWGTTNANASALRALSSYMKPDQEGKRPGKVTIEINGKSTTLEVGGKSPVAFFETDVSGELLLKSSRSDGPLTVREQSEMVPVTGGKKARAEARGFVVTREMLRIADEPGVAPEKIPLNEPLQLSFGTGDVVEEHIQVINQLDRNYVAVVVPLAAGFEVLNPNLQTAPPEATPTGAITSAPAYSTYYDDQVAFYYDRLPKGTYHFYFRTRATTPGSYAQPPAFAEMMYDRTVRGRSPGASIDVVRK